jgi:hypothetical protein
MPNVSDVPHMPALFLCREHSPRQKFLTGSFDGDLLVVSIIFVAIIILVVKVIKDLKQKTNMK